MKSLLSRLAYFTFFFLGLSELKIYSIDLDWNSERSGLVAFTVRKKATSL